MIRLALSDPAKPVYWKDIELLYVEINHLHEGVLTESKALAKALQLKELWRSRRITWGDTKKKEQS